MSVDAVHNESPRKSAKAGLSARRIVSIVLGSLLSLVGIGLLLGAGALGWAQVTQRDSQGYFSTSTQRFTTSTYAITSDRIDLNSGAGPSDWFINNDNVATVRIRAKADNNVFVGIGSQTDVERYLAAVARDEVNTISYRPFSATYRRSPGKATPNVPTAETFWVAKATGAGTQTLTWAPTSGAWEVVVMNADATASVNADISLGLHVSFVGWIIGAFALLGLLALVGGTTLLVVGTRRSGHHRNTRESAGEPGTAISALGVVDLADGPPRRTSPVHLEGHLAEPISRWLWIVKWILLVPHLIVLFLLWIAFGVLTIVAGIAILFTGHYPRALFDFNVGVLRWTWRVQFYGPSAYGTDTYPPFTLGPAPYPATLEIDYPAYLSRWLVLVKSWLLAIPQLLIVGFFCTGGMWNRSRNDGSWRISQLAYSGGLIGTCATIAGLVVLIRGRRPAGLFSFTMGMNRWVFRVIAYVALMTDEYPPFHFDGGPTEPAPPGEPAPADPTVERRAETVQQQPDLVGIST